MKKKAVSLLVIITIIINLIILPVQAAYTPTNEAYTLVDYLNSKVGESFASNRCQAFVYQSVGNAIGVWASQACAYEAWQAWGVSSSKDIPLGATVYFSGSSVQCGNHRAGHVGIYVGDGYIIHAASSKVQKTQISYIENYWSGYDYLGWGWNGGHSLTTADAEAPTFATLSINKESYNINENVTFTFNADNNARYTLAIYKDDTRIDTVEVRENTYTRTFVESDSYSAYMTAYNDAGYKDSNWIGWEIKPINILGNSVDIGTNFFAYIINYSSWLPIAVNSESNVVLEKETGMQNQLWKFTLLPDGSYKIISLLDGKALDVDYAKNELGTNIKSELFTDSEAQHWYIYGKDGNYKLKAKCTDYVMDVGGGNLSAGANIQTYTYNNTKAQNFQIYKVDSTFALGKPIDIGDDFTAYIINHNSSLPIAVTSDRNVVLDANTKMQKQLWHFNKLSDGSYKIISLLDGKALDVDCAKNELGTNIKSELFTDSEAQHWYIYGKDGNYKLKAKCTDYVMDVGGGSLSKGANIQTYVYNDTEAQKFDIVKLDVDRCPVTKIKIINDKLYLLFDNEKDLSWSEAKYLCKQLGGYLATIDEVKVMVWDSLSGLKPLCYVEVIPSSEFIIE